MPMWSCCGSHKPIQAIGRDILQKGVLSIVRVCSMGCVDHSIYVDGIVILSIEVILCEGTGSREVWYFMFFSELG